MNEKCHFCADCDGRGCIGEIPGMGGSHSNENCILNRDAWRNGCFGADFRDGDLPAIRLAPITGAVQNVGYPEERPFYHDIIAAAALAGIGLSIGDGYPDEKLRFGIEALLLAGKTGAVFIKPYENHRIIERMGWATPVATLMGVDIDSHGIATMKGLATLEKKTARQLLELREASPVPFAVKGIFLEEDLELAEAVRPDIVVISNHGGRVNTRTGSTAEFLATHGKRLARCSGEVWVDGGLRTERDLAVAKALGASEVLIGRPFIQALLSGGREGIRARLTKMTGVPENVAVLG